MVAFLRHHDLDSTIRCKHQKLALDPIYGREGSQILTLTDVDHYNSGKRGHVPNDSKTDVRSKLSSLGVPLAIQLGRMLRWSSLDHVVDLSGLPGFGVSYI